MYYRWQLPDERPIELVEGANQEKMYPDYAYAAQDGSDIKRKVKIGALTITALLIIGAIAAVPAVLLTLPKLKHGNKTAVVEPRENEQVSRDAVSSGNAITNGKSNALRHDNLTISNRSRRQMVEQTVNIGTHMETVHAGCKMSHESDKSLIDGNDHQMDNEKTNQTGIASAAAHQEKQIIPGDEQALASHLDNAGDNDQSLKALNILANFKAIKAELDRKLSNQANTEMNTTMTRSSNVSSPPQQNATSEINISDLGNPRVIIVFYSSDTRRKSVHAVDFGNKFLKFIQRDNVTGAYMFDSDSLVQKSREALNPLFVKNQTDAGSAPPKFEMKSTDKESFFVPTVNDTNDSQAAGDIAMMLMKNQAFTWILADKIAGKPPRLQYITGGPLDIGTLDILTVLLVDGINRTDLHAIVAGLIDKISLFLDNSQI